MPGAYLCGGSEGIPLCAGGNASRRGRIPAAPDERGQPGGSRRGELGMEPASSGEMLALETVART